MQWRSKAWTGEAKAKRSDVKKRMAKQWHRMAKQWHRTEVACSAKAKQVRAGSDPRQLERFINHNERTYHDPRSSHPPE